MAEFARLSASFVLGAAQRRRCVPRTGRLLPPVWFAEVNLRIVEALLWCPDVQPWNAIVQLVEHVNTLRDCYSDHRTRKIALIAIVYSLLTC